MRTTSFQIKQTGIEGLVLIDSFFSQDARGYYKKVFEREAFEQAGMPTQFLESSTIQSQKGAVRGLHYQEKHSQGKLLYVLKGAIYDVALDLRRESTTFGKWLGITLTENDAQALYVPPGFAHGFMALEDETLFSYLCTNYYEPDSCGGILWNDPAMGIPWPIREEGRIIITEKDRRWPTLAEYCRAKGIPAREGK